MKSVLLSVLLAAAVLAEDPHVETKKEKVLEKIADEKYSAAVLKDLGSKTNICKHLEDEHIKALNSKLDDKAYLKLNSKCILDLLKEDEDVFKKLAKPAEDDEKDMKKFFNAHAEVFCENKSKFKELDKEKWVKPLDNFCSKWELEKVKKELAAQKKKLEEATPPTKSDAASGYAVGCSVAVSAIALAALIFA